MKLKRAVGTLKASRGVYKPIGEVEAYLSRFGDLPFVLVHIPKNGGTSILDALGLTRPRVHATAWEMHSVCETGLAGKELIAVYRDPVARFVSAHQYYLRGGNGGKADRALRDRLESLSATETLSTRSGLMELARTNRAFWPQTAYLLDPFGNFCVDRVFRIDDLTDEFERYCQSKEITVPRIRKINITAPSESTLPRSVLAAVESFYACDAELAQRIKVVAPT